MNKKLFLLLFMLICILTGCGSKDVTFIYNDEIIYQTTDNKLNLDDVKDVEKEGYNFKGWEIISNTDSQIIYGPKFEVKTFSVKFYILNELYYEDVVEYGKDASVSEVNLDNNLHFRSWDKDFTNVKNDLIIQAIIDNVYTVKFYNGEELIKEEQVIEGNDAKAPEVTPINGYKFIGWDNSYYKVSKDLEIHAKFELENYTISYKDDSGKTLDLEPKTYNINSDASISLPEAPEKEGYEFLGWYEKNNRVVTFFSSDAENKEFVAKYEKKEEEKILTLPSDGTFMFTNIKKVAHSSGNGTYVYQPDFTGLTVPSVSATKWTWSSLDESVAKISQWSSITIVSTGYAILKAVYISDNSIIGYAVIKTTPDGVFISSIEEANNKVNYTVTFLDINKNIIETQSVENGKTATYPIPPTVEGYCFIGWSAENYNISSNTTIEANYIQGNYSFAGKSVSILGDSISTYKGYIPDGYAAFYPYPTADFGDVNQTWWMRVINNLGMKLVKNNSYSGSCVSTGTGSSGTTNDARLAELIDGTTKPDVIIIYMGANDCASSSVSLDTFKTSYVTMINKIKALTSESEIYVMTLPSTKLYSESDKEKYNQAIRDIAVELSLNLIEMKDTFTSDNYKDYVVDSCHPNKAGMIKVSETVMKAMLNIKGITLE